jgi:transcriptional regulator with XRE-family HTH domain
MNKRKLIAHRIKEARKEQGITQMELALKLNQDRSSISYIENGKITLAADRIGDFSRALNKPILYFLSDI